MESVQASQFGRRARVCKGLAAGARDAFPGDAAGETRLFPRVRRRREILGFRQGWYSEGFPWACFPEHRSAVMQGLCSAHGTGSHTTHPPPCVAYVFSSCFKAHRLHAPFAKQRQHREKYRIPSPPGPHPDPCSFSHPPQHEDGARHLMRPGAQRAQKPHLQCRSMVGAGTGHNT